ncbi:hypothetical protein H5410_001177 [Solanum commersonii]|uniref:Uncharacterized protein n=1 Tax=Solanum commersonii TaxID=4109 RepID=A0A9J6AYD8_SOLCO|nr:hypothetical protein H5410_001177 [Solanum commersonii]
MSMEIPDAMTNLEDSNIVDKVMSWMIPKNEVDGNDPENASEEKSTIEPGAGNESSKAEVSPPSTGPECLELLAKGVPIY